MDNEASHAERAWVTLLSLRNEDLRLVWVRSSVLMAIQGGLFAVHAALVSSSTAPEWVVLTVDLAGIVLAVAWARIAHVGIYYQRYWQHEMAAIEPQALGEFAIWASLTERVKLNKMPELGGFKYRSMGRTTASLPYVVIVAWLAVAAGPAFEMVSGLASP